MKVKERCLSKGAASPDVQTVVSDRDKAEPHQPTLILLVGSPQQPARQSICRSMSTLGSSVIREFLYGAIKLEASALTLCLREIGQEVRP